MCNATSCILPNFANLLTMCDDEKYRFFLSCTQYDELFRKNVTHHNFSSSLTLETLNES